jgi:hypothetical protein
MGRKAHPPLVGDVKPASRIRFPTGTVIVSFDKNRMSARSRFAKMRRVVQRWLQRSAFRR